MKFVLFVILVLFSTVTHAENWQMLTESADGTRLIVDVDSVKISKYSETNDNLAAHAKMKYIGVTNEPLVFLSFIDVEDCLVRGSGKITNIIGTDTNVYFWTSDRKRMYDIQGQYLCLVVLEVIENINKKEKKSKKKEYHM